MTSCEMCGKGGTLLTVNVEGAEMQLCAGCSCCGTALRKNTYVRQKKMEQEEPQFMLVDDVAQLLRSARESKKMTQEEFAALLQEREGIVAKWEQGSLKPGIDAARRIGRILKLRLVRDEPDQQIEVKKHARDEPTLGDFMKIRTRK